MKSMWLFTAIQDEDHRWDDTRFTSAGETIEEAARALVADKEFLDWWGEEPLPERVWGCPLHAFSGVSRVDPDRKYLAEEFESMWNTSVEIEVKL